MTDALVEVRGLTKRFGAVTAVDGLSFSVAAGRVVGFLGPNGAGKTTTLRSLLGLVTPTSGTATIAGRRYADLRDPIGVVGALLESTGYHPSRSAIDHLRILAMTSGRPAGRAAEVLDEVGLSAYAGRAVGGYSLGMRQRLALGAALLGRPQLLVLDEPANGLDPEGIQWLRGFLRYHAEQGGTVLLSSHLLSEVAQTVDEVVIIARGRLVTQSAIGDLVSRTEASVRVRSPDAARLAAALTAAGHAVSADSGEVFTVAGVGSDVVGVLAADLGVVLHELTPQHSSLEAVFMELTADPEVAA
ncbi:MAG: type transport system ATP-binding protein [Frankiaceae bacterium]|nr:type transport system ATP-binding protein [Frankiaceae bacterium]